MFIPIFSDLIKIRIYSSKTVKVLNFYILFSSLFFLYKSIVLVYALQGIAISILSLILFPLTITFYPMILFLIESYSPFMNNHLLFFIIPLAIRLISRNNKRKYY